jgi:hypothetical protein
MNLQEAVRTFAADKARLMELGVSWEPGAEAKAYVPEEFRRNWALAMDAMPTLTTDPNAGIPAMLTTLIDPQVYEILFSPNKAAEILGENRKGTWLDDAALFPVVEHTGEVSSYGDYANSGRAGLNMNWPARQSYLFQTVKQYGERELERAGLGRINYVSEIDKSAATQLNKFTNLSYFYGVNGLQNYGLLNDPNLPANLTPGSKASPAVGVTWFTTGGAPNCTANEVYNDILAIYETLVTTAAGLVDKGTKLVLAMSPGSQVALDFTNSFGITVSDMLKRTFPGLRFVTAVQYGVLTASNPQGIAAGNMVQMIAESIEGQATGYCSFNEKMRAHVIVREMSAFKQKVTGGTWGAIIRMPVAFQGMVGV